MGKMPEAQNFLIPPRTLVYWSICSSYITRFVFQIFWYSGISKHLLFLCHKICTADLLILWYIEASAALLMPEDLYCKSVETQVHWSICSSYVTRFVLWNCWYSGALKHLPFLCHKICASNLLNLWCIEASALLMSYPLLRIFLPTLVLQICWYSGT